MQLLGLAANGAWRVLLAGLVLGAGVPVVFALGVRAMASTAGAVGRARVAAGRVAGVLCLTIVLATVGTGLTYIVASGFGRTVSFGHGYPTVVAKKH